MQTSKDRLEEVGKADLAEEAVKDASDIPTVDTPSPVEGDIDADSLDIPILTDIYREDQEQPEDKNR